MQPPPFAGAGCGSGGMRFPDCPAPPQTTPARVRWRILHGVFSPRIAGSERYCIDLANRQAALGHEVHVAGVARSPIAGALSPDVAFHGLHNRFLRGLRVRRLAIRLRVHVCHGHLSAACKALGRLPVGVVTVATLHVGYKPHQHARIGGLICVNPTQAGRLAGYAGQVKTIPNWLPAAPARTGRRSVRAELGLGAGVFLVGAVGRLHASKGMDVLVSAFRAAALPNAALVILGEGPQRAELERLRAGHPRVHLLGHRAVVHDCLEDLDVFVSPSREESFGLAILEAMSAGAPVIATRAEGPGEFLRDQPVELLEPGCVSALTAALKAAHARFAAGAWRRVAYDLTAFDPAMRIAEIGEFYAQVRAVKVRASQPVLGHAVPAAT